MKENWTKSITKLLKTEGGYVNNKLDSGGETNFGISKKSYPKEDIKNMTKERAIQIYKTNYWDRCKCDNLPSKIDEAVFSFAVNSGSITAIKTLQKAIGVTADGIIGPKTLVASKKEDSYKNFIMAWLKKYVDIVKKKSDQMVFLNGWINRVIRVMLD